MTVRVVLEHDSSPAAGEELRLPAPESKYLVKVRRRAAGDQLEVLSRDAAWHATLIDAGSAKQGALVRIDSKRAAPTRALVVHLIVGIVERGPTLELIKHACALDIVQLTLTHCARSQGRAGALQTLSPGAKSEAPSEAQFEAKFQAKVDASIDAARRQSGRADRMRVQHAASLAAALGESEFPLWYAHPSGASTTASGTTVSTCRLALGPEGGFDPDELQSLVAAGGRALELGPWILRTELALPTAVGQLQALAATHASTLAC